MPDPEDALPEDMEREVSRLAAAAAAKLLQKNQAEEAQKQAEAQAKAEREAKLAAQSYLEGTVGDRVVFSGTVKVSKSFDGHYGPSVLTVVAVGASEVKFFSTAKFAWALNEGDEVTLSAEISGYEVYGDAKQTVVKRAKLA
jgi:hypothetical protein